MLFDITTITAVREELCEIILGMRIEKVQQPQRNMIILTLNGKASGGKATDRKTDKTQKLLISVNINDIRVHLTEHTFENPTAPPMFCMLLRKYLTGAKIKAIKQPPAERIMDFTMITSPVIGEASDMRLVLELFGHAPNIILIDNEGIIVDCMRRIGGDINSGKRMLLPGLRYRMPEPPPYKNELKLIQQKHIGSQNISKTLDEMYTQKNKNEDIRQRYAILQRTMKSAQKRVWRRLEAQKNELKATQEREYLRQNADIIMANMYKIKKGDTVLTADNFFSQSDEKRSIELNPLLSAQKNAEKYYKAYTKARNAQSHLERQISNAIAELEYIESVIEELTRVESMQEIEEIREELIQTKYLKTRDNKTEKKTGRTKKAKKTVAAFKPLQFISSSGIQILAGKNNIQNDILTFKTAQKTDIWLHAQKLQGSHVIIRTMGTAVDDISLNEAAAVAAYYCAARNAVKVSVDYTPVKYVRKQPGAHPGMVIYTNYKTIIAQPNEELIMKIKE